MGQHDCIVNALHIRLKPCASPASPMTLIYCRRSFVAVLSHIEWSEDFSRNQVLDYCRGCSSALSRLRFLRLRLRAKADLRPLLLTGLQIEGVPLSAVKRVGDLAGESPASAISQLAL